MRFSLTLAATSCLLALSSATTVGISGNTQVVYNVNDGYCHNVPTMDSPRLQVLVIGTPVTFYSGSNCQNSIRTAFEKYNQWQFITGPIRSYRVTSSSYPPLNTPGF
ncbi:hypothetical protein GGF44_003899 [Coemansia sp. RSA 1694]|nr:hypothetical protein GGF44_003899 [Coemansia sp. RSA 1694]